MQKSLKLDAIDTSFSGMRLTRVDQIKKMQSSLETIGQLQPIVVRPEGSVYQILDGFKRYYASQDLKWGHLDSHVLEVDDITAKTMILSYNQHSSPLVDYEEAKIVYSLKKEHLMKQEEIAILLSRSRSWVCRRLSFIEKLDDCVGTHLRLGKITPTHARELVKLPRGKQNDFLEVIIGENLTSRQSSKLVTKYLQSATDEEQNYLLKHPLEAIEQQSTDNEISDCRLSNQGNRLLKTLRLLSRQQHIFIGQSSNPPLDELYPLELEVLSKNFRDVVKKSNTIQSILTKYHDYER